MKPLKLKEDQKTLQDYFSDFLNVKIAQGIGETQLVSYKRTFKRFFKNSRNSVVYEDVNADILEYLAAIPNTSPARYNQPYRLFNCFLGYLVDNDVIPANPIKKNKLKEKRDEGSIKPLEKDEIQKFWDAIDKKTIVGLRTFLITVIMVDCGIRPVELFRLKDSDYDAKAHQLFVSKANSKTNSDRILPLSEYTCNLINKWKRNKQDYFEDWLIPNTDGKKMTTHQADMDMQEICKKAGFRVILYRFRHTCATDMLKNGMNLMALQKIMGHTNLNMTKRYIDIDEEYKKQQHDAYTPINNLMSKKRKRKVTCNNDIQDVQDAEEVEAVFDAPVRCIKAEKQKPKAKRVLKIN